MDQNQLLTETLAKLLSGTMEVRDNAKKTSKSKVKVLVAEDGTRVRQYENQMNPDRPIGYVVVEEMQINNSSLTWKRRRRKSALIKGEVDVLKEWLNEYKSNILPGRIVIQEFVESEVPEELAREFIPSDDNPRYDELYESLIKKNGNDEDAIPLTKDGEFILRFSIYDEFDELEEIKVVHDNVDEVRENSKQRRMRDMRRAEERKKQLEEEEKAAQEEMEVTSEEEGNLPE